MEYALKVLNRYGPALGTTPRRKHFVDEVVCAYCGGGGADPKYSSASGCPVCRGAGSVRVAPRWLPAGRAPAPGGWAAI